MKGGADQDPEENSEGRTLSFKKDPQMMWLGDHIVSLLLADNQHKQLLSKNYARTEH